MSFRDKMRGRESNAEIDMLVAAGKAYREGRLKDWPMTQRPIILWHTIPDESYDAARVELYFCVKRYTYIALILYFSLKRRVE